MNRRAKRELRNKLRREAAQALAEGKSLTALNSLNELIELGSVEADDWLLASNALLKVREYAQALLVSDNSLQLRPNCPELLYNKASALFQLGDVTAAVSIFERLGKSSKNSIAWQSLATIIPGCPVASHERILSARQTYAKLAAVEMGPQKAPNDLAPRESDGRIRVGYVSAFFHRSNYMKPVWGLINGHDRHRFEVHLFVDDCDASGMHWFNSGPHDRVHFTSSLSNEEFRKLVVQQQLDILVDLNGYSVPQRLPLLTQRLAHHCVAWFNMYATSGMQGVDWIIGDKYVVEVEEESHYSERVKRLPQSYLSF